MSGKHERDPERERFWRDAVAAWADSGQSIRDFCASRGLSEPNFYVWRRELEKRDREQPSSRRAAKFVPVRVVADAMVEVVLGSGLVVRVPVGADAGGVAQLVAALRAASC